MYRWEVNMRNWKATVNIAEYLQSEDLSFIEQRDGIVARIRAASFYDENDDDLVDIVDYLADTESADDFDSEFDRFYDYADDNDIWVEGMSTERG